MNNFIESNENLSNEDLKKLFNEILESTKKLRFLNQENIENTLIYYLIDTISIESFKNEIPITSSLLFKTIEKFEYFKRDSKFFTNRILTSMRLKIEVCLFFSSSHNF